MAMWSYLGVCSALWQFFVWKNFQDLDVNIELSTFKSKYAISDENLMNFILMGWLTILKKRAFEQCVYSNIGISFRETVPLSNLFVENHSLAIDFMSVTQYIDIRSNFICSQTYNIWYSIWLSQHDIRYIRQVWVCIKI